MFRKALLIAATFVLAGCVSGYQQFYQPYVDATTLSDVEILSEEGIPKLIEASPADFSSRVAELRAKGYEVIGYSSFNGSPQSYSLAVAQAKRVKALVVLVAQEYESTEKSTTTLAVPNTSTTHSYGSVTAGGMYGTYSGTSTTHGTSYVPVTTTQYRYNQEAAYFIKLTKKFRFGVRLNDIPADMRASYGRNTGAVVDVVLENTPAFNANVLTGDLLESVNGEAVINAKQALDLLAKVPQDAESATFGVIRSGKQTAITIRLK